MRNVSFWLGKFGSYLTVRFVNWQLCNLPQFHISSSTFCYTGEFISIEYNIFLDVVSFSGITMSSRMVVITQILNIEGHAWKHNFIDFMG